MPCVKVPDVSAAKQEQIFVGVVTSFFERATFPPQTEKNSIPRVTAWLKLEVLYVIIYKQN